MPDHQVAAETLRQGMRFTTPDGLQASVDTVRIDAERNEVVVEYRDSVVTGTEVYQLGAQVTLL